MIQYFLEVTIAWVLFYTVYALFLKRETFFSVNRWYLLHTLWIGALVPFLRKLPINISTTEPILLEPVTFINYSTQLISESIHVPSESATINYELILGSIYLLGVLFFTIKMFYGLKRIWNIYRRGEKRKHENITLVVSKDFHLPFSFLNKVFLHESFLESEAIKEILDHELTHVKSHHTIDVLLMELVSILFWWNPMIYLYKREIRQTHEYVADAYAAQQSHRKNYGHVLLGQSSSGIELALTHQFFNSHLKKRITMLYKEKSAKHKLGRYLLVIPVLIFMCVLYSFKADSNTLIPNNEIVEAENFQTENDDLNRLYNKSKILNDSFITENYKPVRDLRITILHDSNILEVGKKYDFIVHKSSVEEKLHFDFEPSIGSFHFDSKLLSQPNKQTYRFSYQIDRPTKEGEVFTLKVRQGDKVVTKDFTTVGEVVADSSKQETIEKKFIYLHNGEPIELDSDIELMLDGHIEHFSDKEKIKEKFNIDVDEHTEVMHIVGEIRVTEKDLRLVTKWDQSKPMELGKGYLFTLMNEGEDDWNPTVRLVEAALANIDVMPGDDPERSTDFLIRPLRVTGEGQVLTILCENGDSKIEKTFQITEAQEEVVSKKGDYISEEDYYLDGMTDPLIVIDGEISKSKQDHYFTKRKVVNVQVLDTEEAKAKYGNQGKNGAIEFDLSSNMRSTETLVQIEGSNKDCSDPVFVIDGKKVEDITHINPEDILTINVYKNDKILARFAAYNQDCGIVDILTKYAAKDTIPAIAKKTKSIQLKENGADTVKTRVLSEIVGKVIDGKLTDYDAKVKGDPSETRSYYLPKDKLGFELDGTQKFEKLSFRFNRGGQVLEDRMPMKVEILGNPVIGDEVKFSYVSKFKDEITVHINDMNGRPVAHQKYDCSSGQVTQTIKLKKNAPGVYAMTVFQNGVHTSIRFIVN